jgi:hypothetical protein
MVLNIAEIVSKLDPLTLPLTYVTDHHLEVLLIVLLLVSVDHVLVYHDVS